MLQLGHGSKAVETSHGGRPLPAGRAASIGPRLEGRGNAPAKPTSASSLRLQLGHGSKAVETTAWCSGTRRHPASFNWATARRPWKRHGESVRDAHDYLLQLGHGSKAVETGRGGGPPVVRQPASIGPRLEGRGNRRRPSVRLLGEQVASIGPRLEGRGNSKYRVALRDWLGALQLGHGSKAVEMAEADRVDALRGVASIGPRLEGRGNQAQRTVGNGTVGKLQLGHGSKAVETRLDLERHGVDVRASIGPRLEGRGNGGGGGRACERQACFNWATARRPWKPVAGTPSAIGMPRFNWATARRPWKPASAGPEYEVGIKLQLGHGSKAVETLVDNIEQYYALTLQLGHGSKAVETSRLGA